MVSVPPWVDPAGAPSEVAKLSEPVKPAPVRPKERFVALELS